ncbi:MAG: polyhydroxyalkanoate depolymerase, partial [Pseudomonadota bacterium]
RGQTEAVHGLLTNLDDQQKMHWTQPKVGHYGVFNGSRFRMHIQPRIRDFLRAHRRMVRG